ncbi:MAG: hypothetical protein QW655_01840 [Nitrososphaerota archaeon]
MVPGLEALKIIDVEEAPCIVHECSRLEAMKTAAITHTIREELTPSEKGKFLIRCINEGVWRNVEEAARDLGFSKDTVYCWIREAKTDDLILTTRLKKYLDKESKNNLASMPRVVREKIVEEMKNMNEEILLKIKKNIPELFKEILEISKDMDVEEVLEYMKKRISSLLEDYEKKITRFKTFSGFYYELREEDGKLSINVFEKNMEVGRLQIPLTDLRELIRKLQKYVR